MHEFSLAEGLIKAVEEELVKNHCPGSGLTKVCVLVGEMRQVVPETLKFAYKTLASETAAANSTLELKFQPVEAVCRQCAWQGQIEDKLFCCRKCESADLEITAGKELALISMEFEDKTNE